MLGLKATLKAIVGWSSLQEQEKYPFKGSVQLQSKSILIKLTFLACSNCIGTAVHKGVGEQKVSEWVEISRKNKARGLNLSAKVVEVPPQGDEI